MHPARMIIRHRARKNLALRALRVGNGEMEEFPPVRAGLENRELRRNKGYVRRGDRWDVRILSVGKERGERITKREIQRAPKRGE